MFAYLELDTFVDTFVYVYVHSELYLNPGLLCKSCVCVCACVFQRE